METRTLNLESHPEPVELRIYSDEPPHFRHQPAGKPYDYTADMAGNLGPTVRPSASFEVAFTLNRIAYGLRVNLASSFYSSPSGGGRRLQASNHLERTEADGSPISFMHRAEPTAKANSHGYKIAREVEAWMNDNPEEVQRIAAVHSAETCRKRAADITEAAEEWRNLADIIEGQVSQEVTR